MLTVEVLCVDSEVEVEGILFSNFIFFSVLFLILSKGQFLNTVDHYEQFLSKTTSWHKLPASVLLTIISKHQFKAKVNTILTNTKNKKNNRELFKTVGNKLE